MSKATKSKSALRRRTMKKNRKLAQKARFESYRDSGDNSKRRRVQKRRRRRGIRMTKHRLGRCGNTGCQRCNPRKAVS